MGAVTVATCDSCGAELEDASVNHATTLMTLDPESGVVVLLFGRHCGCGEKLYKSALRQQKSHSTKS